MIQSVSVCEQPCRTRSQLSRGGVEEELLLSDLKFKYSSSFDTHTMVSTAQGTEPTAVATSSKGGRVNPLNVALAVSADPPSAVADASHESTSTRPPHTRPRVIYSRADLLTLSKSPLVKPPDAMPSLKDWYGCVCSGCAQIGDARLTCHYK